MRNISAWEHVCDFDEFATSVVSCKWTVSTFGSGERGETVERVESASVGRGEVVEPVELAEMAKRRHIAGRSLN